MKHWQPAQLPSFSVQDWTDNRLAALLLVALAVSLTMSQMSMAKRLYQSVSTKAASSVSLRHHTSAGLSSRTKAKKHHSYRVGSSAAKQAKPSDKKPKPKLKAQEEPGHPDESSEPPVSHIDFDSLSHAYSRYDSGTNKMLNGNAVAAVTDLEEAKRLFHGRSHANSPMETFASLELARAAEASGNFTLACHVYQGLLSNEPNAVWAKLKLARLKAAKGDLNDALVDAREVCSLQPGSPEAHLLLSLLMDRLGLSMQSIVERQRAFELSGIKLPIGAPAKLPQAGQSFSEQQKERQD